MNEQPEMELRVVEVSPRSMSLSIRVTLLPRPDGSEKRVFRLVYHRGKSLMGMVAGGTEDKTVVHYDVENIQGVISMVDGGYDNETQQSPDRKLDMVTVEKYPLTVGEWTLPREKHERPIRIEMITGVLKALLNE